MIFIVIPSLFLRFLCALINKSILNFQSRSMATAIVSAGLADSFMYDFTTISIFLVVAIIGGLRQRHSEGGMSQEQKIGLPGHHYVPLGPYGPPPAPYDAQAPVGNYPQPVQSQPVQYAAPEQNAALGKLAPQPQQVPISSYAAQGQYVAPVQPTSTAQFPPPGQYAAPVQPVQYAPPVQYAGSGQYVPQGMNTTPTIRSVSPLHAPVAMSTALAYTGTSSSVSPPPPHDSYQFHMSPHH